MSGDDERKRHSPAGPWRALFGRCEASPKEGGDQVFEFQVFLCSADLDGPEELLWQVKGRLHSPQYTRKPFYWLAVVALIEAASSGVR